MIRRSSILAVAFVLFFGLAVPGVSAWSVAGCRFTGGNSFLSGNRAYAYTQATNGGCMNVYAKVHYKVDGYWQWSTTAANPPGVLFVTKKVYGADDADLGRHKAVASTGTPSSWKTSY
ncbi:MAG TPA: hypothetical protein ENK55_08465 [Actinobacteria bacterium]|nr:hypothetical protein [Actinomycetota bacterium]